MGERSPSTPPHPVGPASPSRCRCGTRERSPQRHSRLRIRGRDMNRVLVIDDELPMRRTLNIALEAHGYDVSVAENGRTGLDAAHREHPDLIILDLGLP